MAKVIVGATLSLDWFMNDRNGDVSRLYPDFDALHQTEMLREEIRATGAVVMGRRAYDMAQGDLTGYEYQAPIFVLTHHAPTTPIKGVNDQLTVNFVADGIQSAIAQAKAAAGEKQVTVVGGADTAQQCLSAGLVDEIHVGIAPVLLGGGLRFFESADAPGAGFIEHLQLEKIKVLDSPTRTDIWFRVVR